MGRVVRPGWVLTQLPNAARMAGGGTGDALATARCHDWELNYHFGGSVDMRLALSDIKFHVSDGEIATLLSGFHDAGPAALAALADLIEAHREEYDQLVESERVLRALR